MAPIRVLVVDDNALDRKLVTAAIESDPAFAVVGTAPSGWIGLRKVESLQPDVVTLDVEMPDMNGLDALLSLRATAPDLAVVMVSAHTDRGTAAALESLAYGATGYCRKPTDCKGFADAVRTLGDQLLPKIRTALKHGGKQAALGRATAEATPAVTATAASPPAVGVRRLAAGRVEIVAIGVSTGGPNALTEVIPLLPAEFPVPVVITQHMPPMFTRYLAKSLGDKSAMPVREAADGDVVAPGSVWIAPGDYHMELQRVEGELVARLNQGPPENSCRPAVDPMFRSVSRTHGAGVLALVMTGMGQDGTAGARAVREAGGSILAQDEATSVVWGMPGFVVRAGLADEVLPLGEIAAALVRRVQRGRPAGQLQTRSPSSKS
ncbi:MAG: chemotaxis response regulator protein-glutamate methylesterase [Planctomycetota bacterium]